MKKFVTLHLVLALLLGTIPAAMAEQAPTKLVWGTSRSNLPDFSHYEIVQELCAEMNIELEFLEFDEDAFSVMLADGSFPDIVSTSIEFLDTVLKSGYALNIEPYIDEYLNNMKNPLFAETNKLLQMLYPSENNAIYILCAGVGVSDSGGLPDQSRGYIVRWDYYKELGCPPIESDDDYVNVLTEMVRLHPIDANGNPTWAYGVNKSLRDMGGYRASFLNDVAVNLWSTPYLYRNNVITNHLVNGYTDVAHSCYWADIRFQNKLVRNGVYNMEVFTMDDDEFYSLIAEGRFMGLHYVDDALINESRKTDPNSLAAYVVIPSSNTWLYADVNLMLGNSPAYYQIINATSPNKELAMQFINHFYDPDFVREWKVGKQGESWDYIDSVPTMKPEYLEKIASRDEEFVVNRGYARANGTIVGYAGSALHPDGYQIDLSQSKESLVDYQQPWQKDFATYYGEEFWVDAQYKHMKHNQYDAGETIAVAMTDLPTDIKRTLELCNDVLSTARPELLMAETDEEFLEIQNQVLEKLKELGESEAWEWFNAHWEEVREIVLPIFEASCETNGLR